MIDESYHIGDFDDVEHRDASKGEITISKKPVYKSTIIFENSSSSDSDHFSGFDSRYENRDSDAYNNFEDSYGEREIYNDLIGGSVIFDSTRPVNNKGYFQRFIENYVIDSYKKTPNTVKCTIIGIIISILFLSIGFGKTLVISLVVLAANITGQFFDSNPRLIAIINSIIMKLR